MRTNMIAILLLAFWTLGSTAFAQDAPVETDALENTETDALENTETDALENILTEEENASIADEKAAVQEGRVESIVETAAEDSNEITNSGPRVIKTLQKKNFLKIGRSEFSPHLGFVTNDPFINRYLVGAGLTYHLTEIFAIEAVGSYSPDFKDSDWKPITAQLVNENKVSPDISKVTYYGNVNFQFSPIYGKIAVGGRKIINFDIFGTFGTGFVHTLDDADAMQAKQDEDHDFFATQSQHHATTNFGGGFRFIFTKNFALRIEGRSMQYIETISSTTLEMKQNFLLLGSASIFFPGME